MTFILVTVTVLIIFSLELVRRSHVRQTGLHPELIDEHPGSVEVIDRFFHPGHMWVTVSNKRKVEVGIDDFSAHMIGLVQSVDLPHTGQTLQQGEVIAVLRHGIRGLPQVAPVSGRVLAVNKRLHRNPRLLNNSPLEGGWIARIVPANLEQDLRNLMKGPAADAWREAVRARLVRLTSPSGAVLLQDGGQLARNFGERFTDDEWNYLIREFFPTPSTTSHAEKPKN